MVSYQGYSINIQLSLCEEEIPDIDNKEKDQQVDGGL